MKLVYEETDKFSESLKVGEDVRIAGLHASIIAIRVNDKDEMVWDLAITGAPIKKRSKMMLIIPKKLPVTVLT